MWEAQSDAQVLHFLAPISPHKRTFRVLQSAILALSDVEVGGPNSALS
jgi:hypothetical protein